MNDSEFLRILADTMECEDGGETDASTRLKEIAKSLEEPLIGEGYICYLNTETYGDDEPYWCVATEEFWKNEGCLDDSHLNLDIPGFYEAMESMYEGDDVTLDTMSIEEQRQKLIEMGFRMLEDNVI